MIELLSEVAVVLGTSCVNRVLKGLWSSSLWWVLARFPVWRRGWIARTLNAWCGRFFKTAMWGILAANHLAFRSLERDPGLLLQCSERMCSAAPGALAGHRGLHPDVQGLIQTLRPDIPRSLVTFGCQY